MDDDQNPSAVVQHRILTAEHAGAYHGLLEHLITTSGRDGNPVHSPFDHPDHWDGSSLAERCVTRWSTPVGQPGWGRVLGLFVDGTLVGHATLKERWPLRASKHRADFSMGLHAAIQRRGHGRRLLEATIDYARTQAVLRWLDLGVFATNERAFELYRRAGFVETGRTVDCFRLFGESVDDISMSLDLDR